MLLASLLTALLAAGPALPPGQPSSAVVPPEPDAQVLTDAITMQSVAADLDHDGHPEVVALTEAPDGGVLVEAWSETNGSWIPTATPVGVALPGADRPNEVDPDRGPIRLHVRRADEGDRVTLARQPVGVEPDFADPCCLELADVVVEDGALRLDMVAEPIDAVGALRVVDLDGDGIDELFASRSLPPLGDIGFPIETLVFRWDGTRFGAPTTQQLPVGSGDTPFFLGDSDGRPGDELGIIATIGRPAFYRIGLDVDGTLRVEDSRLVPLPDAAIAVPIPDGRGVATLTSAGTLEVRPWPAGAPIGEPEGHTTGLTGGRLLGIVAARDRPHLVVRQAVGVELLHLLELPSLRPIVTGAPRGGAAPAFSRVAPVVPYAGSIPAGGPDRTTAILAAGRLVMATSGTPDGLWGRAALLPGAVPVGLVGRDRTWLAIHHVPMGRPPDPAGGRLDPPVRSPGSGLTVAPFSVVAEPEDGDATFVPEIAGRALLDDDGSLTVGAGGFVALVEAPPGSRIYTSGLDPTVVSSVVVVGDRGRAEIRMPPPTTGTPDPRYRAALSITTPAGHGYLATWSVRVLTDPPALDVSVRTPLGSSDVVISGTAPVDAEVRVAGRRVSLDGEGRFETTVTVPPWPTEVAVTATDPVGNESRRVLTAFGVVDIRTIPWIPLAGVGLALVALALALRVPRARPFPAGVHGEGDDVVLEELEPDA